jgi:AraC family transcriptional regulator, arabinose operon regulatory protein
MFCPFRYLRTPAERGARKLGILRRMAVSNRRWWEISARQWAKTGAYDSPFSQMGMEFLPLGVQSPDAVLLHEAGYLPRHPHWNYPNVFSPFWRLYYDLRPGHFVVFKHARVALGPDKIVLIPDRQLFDTVGAKPRPHFWLHFSHADHLAPDQKVPIELRPAPAELCIVEEMSRLLDPALRTSHQRRRVYHCALALLNLTLSRPEIRWQAEMPQKLAETIQFIEEHYASPLYCGELARMAHMSESLFRHRFSAFCKVSPAHFIDQTRVREAARLLMNTPLAVNEIAERCGLTSNAYLSRVFKKITGQSPLHFRRHARVS